LGESLEKINVKAVIKEGSRSPLQIRTRNVGAKTGPPTCPKSAIELVGGEPTAGSRRGMESRQMTS